MWGVTRSPRPALRAARLTTVQPACRPRRRPRPVTKSGSTAGRFAGLPGEPGRPDLVEVADQPLEGHLPDRHEPLLVALADHPDERAIEREILAIEVERLADPQAGGVEQFEEGAVAQPGRHSGPARRPVLARPRRRRRPRAGGSSPRCRADRAAAGSGGAGRSGRRGRSGSARRRRQSGRSRGSRRPGGGGWSTQRAPTLSRLGAGAGQGSASPARPTGPSRGHDRIGREGREIAAVGAQGGRRQPALDPQVDEVVPDRDQAGRRARSWSAGPPSATGPGGRRRRRPGVAGARPRPARAVRLLRPARPRLAPRGRPASAPARRRAHRASAARPR